MKRSIKLVEPGRWELEIAGGDEFVTDMARRLGLYVQGSLRVASEGGGESGGEGASAKDAVPEVSVGDVPATTAGAPAAVPLASEPAATGATGATGADVAAAPSPVAAPAETPGSTAAPAAEGDADADADEDVSVDSFYRGFLGARDPATVSPEDLVVLFGYYLENHMGKTTWTTLDMSTCFTFAGLEQPRNMIGLLSNLVRQKGSVVQESTGEYRLADRSTRMLRAVLRL